MPIYRIGVGLSNHTGSPPSTNVFHFRTVDGDGDAIADAERNSAVSALRDFYVNLQNSLGAGVRVSFPDFVLRVGTEEAEPITQLDPVDSTVTEQAPPVLTMCINWITSSRSRRGRGRTFIGPLNAAVIAPDGNPVAAYVNDVESAAKGLVSASTGANGWAFGVYGQEMPRQATPKVLRDFTDARVARDQFSVMTSRRDRP